MKLRELVDQYVSYRKSLGSSFRTAGYHLRAFSRAMGDDIDVGEVRPERVSSFLAGGGGPITSYWHSKYGTLSGFYLYAISCGHATAIPLPTEKPRAREYLRPYIYTVDELRRILDVNASYPIRIKIEPHTMRTILLLLYGAGLRIGEALHLTLADVDMQDALIVVRETKFHKTRLVPVGPQLQKVLSLFVRKRSEAGHSQDGDAPFFTTRRGAPIKHLLMGITFRRLCVRAGVVRTDGASFQPRLHDLRHTFAVQRLTAWYRTGAEVQQLLPKLATYLGHLSIAETQVYLTMTPALLQEASLRFEHYATKEAAHE